ncbi:MAG: DUF3857 domain-containing transglutaminase family protein, partial [Pontixanthobacter sp.]
MRAIVSILAGLAAFAPAHLAAQSDESDRVQKGPTPGWVSISEPLAVPDDATGLVFIRRQDTLVRLHDEGQTLFTSQLTRLLHPQALQAGNISIAWNPAVGDPTVHGVRIHRGATMIDVLDKTGFEILRREDNLEQSMLDGILTAVLRVPDLRVGDDLEVAYSVPSHDPTLRDESFGILFLADTPPPGRLRVGLSWDDGQEPTVRMTDDISAMVTRTGNAIEVAADNLPILTAPQNAPPRYSWQRILQYSDFDDWQSVSRRFHPLYMEAAELGDRSPIISETDRISVEHSSDIDKMQAALEFVQRQVRYVYVGLNSGNLTPIGADETWERRYADCKGKTVLLLAMLEELGIEAEAVLVNTSGLDDGLDERLPTPGMFDHVLVRANVDGRTYWLDGTLPDVVVADTTPILPYRWVLPLSAKGSRLEPVDQKPFALPQEMGLIEIDAREGFDVPARQKWVQVARGVEGLAQYMQLSALTKDQILTAWRNGLTGKSEWQTVDSVSYRYDKETRASILEIEGTADVDWDDDGDGRRSL